MTIPTGNYPKMAYGTDAGGRTVNLVYPTGAKQGTYVIFLNATEEAAYDGTGIAAMLTSDKGSAEHRYHK